MNQSGSDTPPISRKPIPANHHPVTFERMKTSATPYENGTTEPETTDETGLISLVSVDAFGGWGRWARQDGTVRVSSASRTYSE